MQASTSTTVRLSPTENQASIIRKNKWNVSAALATRNSNRHLRYLDRESYFQTLDYREDPLDSSDLGKPDSALVKLAEIVKQEPRLKYAPIVGVQTFRALLKTDPQKAYAYGTTAIVTPTNENPPADVIAGAVDCYEDRLTLPPEIFSLAAEARQVEIDGFPYPENVDIAKMYNKMAEWYWRAIEPQKAIATQQKAIATLKTQSNFSTERMAVLEERLQQYTRVPLQ